MRWTLLCIAAVVLLGFHRGGGLPESKDIWQFFIASRFGVPRWLIYLFAACAVPGLFALGLTRTRERLVSRRWSAPLLEAFVVFWFVAQVLFLDNMNRRVASVIACGAAMAVLWYRTRRPARLLGLTRCRMSDVAMGLCVAVASFAVSAVAQEGVQAGLMSSARARLTLIGTGVVTPIVEEIVFRGFLYGALRSRWGVAWSLVISSMAFSAIHHRSVLGHVDKFVSGALLAFLYEKRGSLYGPIAAHATHNIALVTLYMLGP